MDIRESNFCPSALKNHWNVHWFQLIMNYRNPYKRPANFQSKNDTLVTLCVVNLERKSWLIGKTYFQIKFIGCVSKDAQELPKYKNPIKFPVICRSDACNVRSIKFNLGAVPASCFELSLSMKEHTQQRIEKLFLETVHVKTHKLILKINSRNTKLASGSVPGRKIGRAHGKSYST